MIMLRTISKYRGYAISYPELFHCAIADIYSKYLEITIQRIVIQDNSRKQRICPDTAGQTHRTGALASLFFFQPVYLKADKNL